MASDRHDLSLGVPFLVLAISQAVGTPLFAAILDFAGVTSALIVSAVTACLSIVIRQ